MSMVWIAHGSSCYNGVQNQIEGIILLIHFQIAITSAFAPLSEFELSVGDIKIWSAASYLVCIIHSRVLILIFETTYAWADPFSIEVLSG